MARSGKLSPKSTEGKLVASDPAALAADLLVVGHHGSLTSSRRALLDAMSAKIFVISSGPHPYQKAVLPDVAIVAALKDRGAAWRTDLDDAACEHDPAKPGPDNDDSRAAATT